MDSDEEELNSIFTEVIQYEDILEDFLNESTDNRASVTTSPKRFCIELQTNPEINFYFQDKNQTLQLDDTFSYRNTNNTVNNVSDPSIGEHSTIIQEYPKLIDSQACKNNVNESQNQFVPIQMKYFPPTLPSNSISSNFPTSSINPDEYSNPNSNINTYQLQYITGHPIGDQSRRKRRRIHQKKGQSKESQLRKVNSIIGVKFTENPIHISFPVKELITPHSFNIIFGLFMRTGNGTSPYDSLAPPFPKTIGKSRKAMLIFSSIPPILHDKYIRISINKIIQGNVPRASLWLSKSKLNASPPVNCEVLYLPLTLIKEIDESDPLFPILNSIDFSKDIGNNNNNNNYNNNNNNNNNLDIILNNNQNNEIIINEDESQKNLLQNREKCNINLNENRDNGYEDNTINLQCVKDDNRKYSDMMEEIEGSENETKNESDFREDPTSIAVKPSTEKQILYSLEFYLNVFYPKKNTDEVSLRPRNTRKPSYEITISVVDSEGNRDEGNDAGIGLVNWTTQIHPHKRESSKKQTIYNTNNSFLQLLSITFDFNLFDRSNFLSI